MAKADSMTRGRELNIHIGDLDRGFVGQISHLGDMVPVMAGITLSFKMRNEPRVGLVYVGDGATSTGAFHEGINFAAVQRCPLVVIVENNGYAYSTPTSKQTAARSFADKAVGYGVPGVRADGNDVLETYRVTKEAVARARGGEGVTLIELMTYRRKGHAEHDNQSYVPAGEIDHWAATNDPLDRYGKVLTDHLRIRRAELEAADAACSRKSTRPPTSPNSRRRPMRARRSSVSTRIRRPCRRCGTARAWAAPWRRTSGRRAGAPSMAEITYLEAIREGLTEEMERDANVFCLGEDIGAYGGAFKVTEGLMQKFGEARVIDTPISEAAIVGAAAGAAHMGLRPVCEMQFIDFISCAYDMLTNYVATARYRAFLPTPMVVRGPSGGYVRGGPFHSQNPEAAFLHTPGPQDRVPGHGARREGPDQGRDPRRGLRALLRAQVPLPPGEGHDAGG